MPSNGAAALPLELNPPHRPHRGQPVADKPALGPTEIAIGEAVADAAISIAVVPDGYRQTGILAQAAKEAGGSRFARVAMLQLDHALGDDDFIRRARDAGKCVLLRRHFSDECSRQLADVAIKWAIDSVFEVVSHVVKDERALRIAWAN
jgi:hypothetical protein